MCCISTALLVFGVYSANQIDYSLTGNIFYEVNSLYTDVSTSLYALTQTQEQSEIDSYLKMVELKDSLDNNQSLPDDIVKLDYSSFYSTMNNNISEEDTLLASETFGVSYDDYDPVLVTPTAYTFYLVFEVKNYSSETISALLDFSNITNNTTNTTVNSLFTKANIYGKTGEEEYGTFYFVSSLSFDKHSILKSYNFDNITFTVNTGELVSTPLSQFTFTTSNGQATLTSYVGDSTDVVIPSHLDDGTPVTELGGNAFRNKTIQNVYIPDTISVINDAAFSGCTNLSNVDIQSNCLTSIGYSVFSGCSSLQSITIPNSVISIGRYAFNNCSSLQGVTLPNNDNFTTIEGDMFYNCKNLQSITVPGSVTSIGSYAFRGCSSLQEVTLPNNDNFTTIERDTFNGCSSLQTITIPKSVTSIGYSAFSECSSIKRVHYLGTVNDWLNISFHDGTSNPIWYGANLYINGTLFEEIKAEDFTDGKEVTKINDYAFSGCVSLKSVTIPSGVTSIGSSAFYRCSSIKDVYYLGTVNDWLNISFGASSSNPLNNGANLYINGTLLLEEIKAEDFTIGKEVTAISDYAFYNCKTLKSVTIPSGVTSIGSYAFRGCRSLQSITVPGSVTSIGSYAFYGCSSLQEVTLPDNNNLSTIENYTFYGCNGLTSITIPDSVTSIGSYAFDACSNIKEVYYLGTVNDWFNISFSGSSSNPLNNGANLYINDTLLEEIRAEDFTIGKEVTAISEYAFYNCKTLKSVTIPSGVTSIGSYAFNDCSSLQSIIVPDTVTSIRYQAFTGCSNIKEVYYLGTVNDWLNISFGDLYSNPLNNGANLHINDTLLEEIKAEDFTDGNEVTKIGYAFYGCNSLKTITIPETVTSIGSSAFYGCSNLQEVTLPDNDKFTTIERNTFDGCSSLQTITIPANVTSIGSQAFYNCSSLQEVTLPDNDKFTTIESNTFYNCCSLSSITIPANVTTIGSQAFWGCSNLFLVINLSTSITISLKSSSNGYVGYYAKKITNTLSQDNFYTQDGIHYYEDNEIKIILGIDIEGYTMTIPEGTVAITSGLVLGLLPESAGKNVIAKVVIPSSVTSIGSSAFSGFGNLKEVYYLGTVNDWLNIRFSNDTSNPMSYGANLYINDTLLEEIKANDFTDGKNITRISDYAFYNCKSLQSITIADTVETIGSRAFSGCSSLQSITVPGSVTSIGSLVFYGCSSITEVHYLGTVNDWLNISFFDSYANPLYFGNAIWYMNDTLLEEITVEDFTNGKEINTISEYAFYGCASLKSITIPANVTSIGSSAFDGCSNLQEVTLPNNTDFTTIGSNTFSNCSSLQTITIPETVTSIGRSAFYNCSSLQSIIVPKSVTSIGSSAFNGCSSLQEVTLPDNDKFTTIENHTFSECSDLQIITIPGSVTSIGDSAFYSCYDLQTITIPGSVTSIGSYAFYSCSSIKEVRYLGTVNDWLNISFSMKESNPMRFTDNVYINDSLLEEITAEDFTDGTNKITKINNYAFYGYYSLKKVTIPDFVESIGNQAFYNCYNLQTITIPNTVENIGNYAFDTDYRASSIYRIIVESETVLKGLTGTGTSTMGALLSTVEDNLDRIYIPESIEDSVPDYIKNNWTKFDKTETVNGTIYVIYGKI